MFLSHKLQGKNMRKNQHLINIIEKEANESWGLNCRLQEKEGLVVVLQGGKEGR